MNEKPLDEWHDAIRQHSITELLKPTPYHFAHIAAYYGRRKHATSYSFQLYGTYTALSGY